MTDEQIEEVRLSWERYQKIRHCLKYTDKVTIGYLYELKCYAIGTIGLYYEGKFLGFFERITEKPKEGYVELQKENITLSMTGSLSGDLQQNFIREKVTDIDDSHYYCAAHHVPEWGIQNIPLRYHWDKFIEDEDTVWVRYTAVGLISFALGLFIG